jgi:hypothetical protein
VQILADKILIYSVLTPANFIIITTSYCILATI